MATCRICHEYGSEDRMVRYGIRHRAHFHCYLDAGKPLSDLSPFKVAEFPFRLLKDRGLLEQAEAIVSTEPRAYLVETTRRP